MFLFVYSLVKQQLGIRGFVFLPIFYLIFYLIFLLNIFGVLPFSFTSTSQICYTFTLGFSTFISVMAIAICLQRYNYLKQFVPEVTGPLLPLLVVIELFSYFIRPFSLSIRLFANMLAGHTLVHIISGFGISLFNLDVVFMFILCLPLLAICVLEVGIAFLQAYVFVVLFSIYLKEGLYGH